MPVDDVELWSLDPERNRFRMYSITSGRTLFGEPCLRIVWGRLRRPLRERTEIFSSPQALAARYRELADRRARHGYFVPTALGDPRAVVFPASVPAARPPRTRARRLDAQMPLRGYR